MSKIIEKEKKVGNFHGIKVAREAPTISHLMYADDLLITCRAGVKEAAAFQKIFNLFYNWSGQKMNKEKSSIFFSEFTNRIEKKNITALMGIKEMGNFSIYLETPS